MRPVWIPGITPTALAGRPGPASRSPSASGRTDGFQDRWIRVHQLICFLALQRMAILQRQLHRTGHPITNDDLAHGLQRWHQVVLLNPGGKVERRFRPMSPMQETLFRELGLAIYA